MLTTHKPGLTVLSAHNISLTVLSTHKPSLTVLSTHKLSLTVLSTHKPSLTDTQAQYTEFEFLSHNKLIRLHYKDNPVIITTFKIEPAQQNNFIIKSNVIF